MASMSFVVDDGSTDPSLDQPQVRITITENADGSVTLSAAIEGDVVGDLRGLFFDIANESLLGTLQYRLTTGGEPLPLAQIDDGIGGSSGPKDLRMMGQLLGSDGGYDIGIEIGTDGIGKDDYRSFSFVLSTSTGTALTLADFAGVDFGVRTTSVGLEGSTREDSSKLWEFTTPAIDTVSDSAQVTENQLANGNLLVNDLNAPSSYLTGWSGGSLGQAVTLANAEGVTLTVNSDGTYLLDGSTADRLNENDTLTYTFTYDARQESANSSGTTDWSIDSAQFVVTVQGKNDAPVAQDDDLGTVLRGGTLSGNVSAWLVNDSDIDRGDTFTFAGIKGADGQFHTTGTVDLGSGASIALQADGSYVYTPGTVDLSVYLYQVRDTVGATAVADLTVTVRSGFGGGLGDPPPPVNLFPTMTQALSNVVLYLDSGNGSPVFKVKVEAHGESVYDIDDLMLQSFITQKFGAQTELVGVSIHAGNEYKNDSKPTSSMDGTADGEGVFFLLNDDTPIQAVGTKAGKGGWTYKWSVDDYDNATKAPTPEARAEGITAMLLQQQASQTFSATQVDGDWLIA